MAMGTYLEDFVEQLTTLPVEIKRNFELMRELDKDSQSLLQEIKSMQTDYIDKARKRVKAKAGGGAVGNLAEIAEDKTALEALKKKRATAHAQADEKVAIAKQTYELVDNYIRRLDDDLRSFETDLHDAGALEDEAVKRKHGSQGGVPKKGRHGRDGGSRGHGKGEALGTAILGSLEETVVDPDEPKYCLCGRVSFGEMVGCDYEDCEIEWFHYECVGLKKQPEGKWYCPQCRVKLGLAKA